MEPTRRVTLKEAAKLLGVTKEAVRKRVMRGTIPSDKGEDGRVYVYVDVVGDEPPTHEPDALISQLRDEITYLREESRRKDEIIMQQAMTMRQLTAPEPEPPSEPPESPYPATEQTGRVEPQASVEGQQEGTERRPWWRRLWEWEA
jgi:hypothetical protein